MEPINVLEIIRTLPAAPPCCVLCLGVSLLCFECVEVSDMIEILALRARTLRTPTSPFVVSLRDGTCVGALVCECCS